MTKRIFRSILTVTLTVLVASLLLIVGVLHGYFQDRVLEELARSTAYIARGVEENGMAYLGDDLPKSSRTPGWHRMERFSMITGKTRLPWGTMRTGKRSRKR